jgi:hypothetical protein
MNSDEDLRELGNSISVLVEKAALLQKYAQVLSADSSKFDSNQLISYAVDIEKAADECRNSHQNYIARKS